MESSDDSHGGGAMSDYSPYALRERLYERACAERDAARTALRRLEWSLTVYRSWDRAWESCCQECNGLQAEGHRPACPIAAALGETAAKKERG